VQGQDFYYTLQGWLKGVNMPFAHDPNSDGEDPSMVAKDVTAFTLGYYDGDYTPIDPDVADSTVLENNSGNLWDQVYDQYSHRGLYNGNISWMVTDLAKQGDRHSDRTKGIQAMIYKYDQLHRLTNIRGLTSFDPLTGFAAHGSSPTAYDEAFSYDPNGNLWTLERRDETGAVKDDFAYSYYGGTNRLYQVQPLMNNLEVNSGAVHTDNVVYQNITLQGTAHVEAASNVELKAIEDVTLGSAFNAASNSTFYARKVPNGATYEYDAIGNLILDNEKGVEISWMPQGKVRKVDVHAGTSITTFRYDAMGNRVEKKVVKGDTTTITRYLRDASGNVMTVYNDTTMIEQPIYGSSRVGLYIGGSQEGKSILGLRRYELNNHLGNVLSVISDKVYMHLDTIAANVLSTADYYPFGLTMTGRTWSDSTANHRYGFNGKEKDADSEWGDTEYDYGFRIYNPSIARFLSVDPLTGSYPWYTPYQFAGNTPIQATDLDGLEPWFIIFSKFWGYDLSIERESDRDIEREAQYQANMAQRRANLEVARVRLEKTLEAQQTVIDIVVPGGGVINSIVNNKRGRTSAAEGVGNVVIQAGFELIPFGDAGKLIAKIGDKGGSIILNKGAKFANEGERYMAELLALEGKTVEKLAEVGNTPTADFLVDNVITELKTISKVTGLDPQRSMKDIIEKGLGQSSNVIVDVSKQAGATREVMEQVLERVMGNNKDKKLNFRVIGDGFDFSKSN
jgi:RHS repeat-associated protein